MPQANDLTTDSRFFGLFVGPSGTGKTGFACSFPGSTYVFDFDGRIRGILGCPWIDRANIQYDSYPPKLPGLLKKVNDKLEVILIDAQNGRCPYQNIILDSLTSETYAMLTQAVELTHSDGKKQGERKVGKYIGPVAMADPGDYGFEATNTYNILSALRSIPGINVFITAHVVQMYGKTNPDDPYSPSVVIGEKLSLRDKISENIQVYFDHIFRFNKYEQSDGSIKHTVKFRSDIARTAYAALPNGEVDITGRSGYDVMQGFLKGDKNV